MSRWRLGLGLCVVLSVVSIVRAADDVKITPDVVDGHKDGMALTFDVFTPQSEANGVGLLFMVSGGWYSQRSPPEEALPMFKPMLDAGFTVFAVRHGSSPKFGIPEAVEDVRRSVRYIRAHAEKLGVDPNRLGVFGMSAGGHLSLMLGTAADEGDPNAPDPLLHVTPDDAPALLLVGKKDDLVPIKHSEDIQTAFQEKSVASELLVFDDSSHGFVPKDMEQAMNALVDWFKKQLLK